MIEIKIDDKNTTRFLKNLQKGLESDKARMMLEEASSYIDFKILERTSRGFDLYGREFKPYTPFTKKMRSARGLPTKKVDLFFTGQMLNALTHKSDSSIGRVFFLGNRATQKMQKLNPERPFFGVTEEDTTHIINLVEMRIDELMKES